MFPTWTETAVRCLAPRQWKDRRIRTLRQPQKMQGLITRIFVAAFAAAVFASAQGASFDAAAAEHLLNRAGFGASPEEVENAVKRGRAATVESLLDAGHEYTTEDRFPRITITRLSRKQIAESRPALTKEEVAELAQKASNEAEGRDQRQVLDFRNWWVDRMITSNTPLREKMTLFWAGHFTSSQRDVRNSEHMVQQNEFLRTHALGSFHSLLHGMARDPAMLRYLDNNKNRKSRPNENFAREVMELFTLGEGNYTEQDVKEAARAFTGWNFKGNSFVLDTANHDFGIKTVLGKQGNFDGGDVLDILLARPESSRFLARRLLSFFVVHHPPENLVDRYAAQLLEHQWQITPVVRALFNDPEFYSPQFIGSRILGPIEFGVAIARRARGANRAPGYLIAFASDGMGQSLLSPPNVKGWEGGEAWITSSSLLARGNLALALVQGFNERVARSAMIGASVDGTSRIVEYLRRSKSAEWKPDFSAKTWADITSHEATSTLVDSLCERLLGVEVSPESRSALIKFLEDAVPETPTKKVPQPKDRRFERLLHLILSLPEAQLG